MVYDIEKSKLKCEFNQFTFYFSSDLYFKKFINNVKDYIKDENRKLKIKFGFDIDGTDYFAISFYKRIEKRGFKVYDRANNRISPSINFKIY